MVHDLWDSRIYLNTWIQTKPDQTKTQQTIPGKVQKVYFAKACQRKEVQYNDYEN